MYYNKVDISGVDTSKLKVLKEAEKMELLKRYKNGDRSARNELINGNLRLVLSVIQKFTGRNENPDDLFQVGCIGLMKAIDNFNTELNVKFSTYAVPMISGEVRRYMRDNSPIRVSRSMRDTAYKALQAKEEYIREHQKDPTIQEIADMTGHTRAEVVIALESISDPVSLYEPVYSDAGDTLYIMDQVRDSCDDSDWIDEISLRDTIRSLQPREKNILHLRFNLGKTQVEVAKEIGISQAQVSRLEKYILDKIKSND
ncbi:MAG: RNA polymerase sporulation sigma factor SigG [Oscillospiraceae bacterium]|nr:RNA polymerase sporulation sigma factor SigG [Oscillospiraceae bacterium]